MSHLRGMETSSPQGDEEATAAPSSVASHELSSATPPMAVRTPGGCLPVYAANPEMSRIILTKAAELGRQPDFRADSSHIGLAYMVHHIFNAP